MRSLKRLIAAVAAAVGVMAAVVLPGASATSPYYYPLPGAPKISLVRFTITVNGGFVVTAFKLKCSRVKGGGTCKGKVTAEFLKNGQTIGSASYRFSSGQTRTFYGRVRRAAETRILANRGHVSYVLFNQPSGGNSTQFATGHTTVSKATLRAIRRDLRRP
jgi:hypothetical protein